MNQTGRSAVIAAEMRRYKLEVLDIRERKWAQSGKFKLATGELILYSGHEDHIAPQGVGFMISKNDPKSL